jgi:hypothetical protein
MKAPPDTRKVHTIETMPDKMFEEVKKALAELVAEIDERAIDCKIDAPKKPSPRRRPGPSLTPK